MTSAGGRKKLHRKTKRKDAVGDFFRAHMPQCLVAAAILARCSSVVFYRCWRGNRETRGSRWRRANAVHRTVRIRSLNAKLAGLSEYSDENLNQRRHPECFNRGAIRPRRDSRGREPYRPKRNRG